MSVRLELSPRHSTTIDTEIAKSVMFSFHLQAIGSQCRDKRCHAVVTAAYRH